MTGPGDARALAILCGGGAFPLEVAAFAKASGRPPLMIGVVGAAEPGIEAFAHVWLRLGEVGRLFRLLKEHAIADLAIVGAMTRPEFSDVSLDWGAVRRAPELARLFRGGDNHLLVGIAGIFEREGVKVVGAHEIAPQLLAPAGLVGTARPSPEAEADVKIGAAALAALSPFDAGQGAVVADGRIIALEAAEGTDAMLARIAELRAARRLRFKGPAGVFVKAPKLGQDLRLDMPAVGLKTLEAARRAELRGIALAAGRVLINDRARFMQGADGAGLFVLGFDP